ncbi:Histone deacetylase domain [Trinorchestia longiramus]|nr:Histone deacetylase domain [Trinorchestia longiramus]
MADLSDFQRGQIVNARMAGASVTRIVRILGVSRGQAVDVMEDSNNRSNKGKKNDRSKKMSAPNLMSHEAKSSGKGGRPKVEARISVEELRAKFKKQMSLPGNKDTTDDIPLFDPMEKSRANLMKRRGETGVVFDMQMAEPHCLWDSEYPECPERYTSVINRCTELGLLERCVRVPARAATRQEILSQHSEALHELVKSSETETDVEKLEEISSRYNSIYLHPKTSAMAELAAGSCVDLVTAVVEGRVHNGMAIVRLGEWGLMLEWDEQWATRCG